MCKLLLRSISDLSNQYLSSKNIDNVDFHKRFHQTLMKMDSFDFISQVIEQNLSH
jgi:hypothetical protein